MKAIVTSPASPGSAPVNLTVKTSWRVRVTQALQLLGIGALYLKTPDAASVLAVLPVAISGHILAIGAALVASKPAINLVGDLIDDGKLDGSFKSIIAIAGIGFGMALNSCTLPTILPPDKEGCFGITSSLSGQTFTEGPCVDASGKIDRYRALWTNADGVHLRTTYTVASKRTRVEYSHDGLTWIEWDSKAGVSLDGAPTMAHLDAAG